RQDGLTGGPGGRPGLAAGVAGRHQARARRRSDLLPDSRASFSSSAPTTKSMTETSDLTQWSFNSRWSCFGILVASCTQTSPSLAIMLLSPGTVEILDYVSNHSR